MQPKMMEFLDCDPSFAPREFDYRQHRTGSLVGLPADYIEELRSTQSGILGSQLAG